MNPALYSIAIRQSRRFHSLSEADREDLIQDTFERLIVSDISIDESYQPNGFIYHAMRFTLVRRFQKEKYESREGQIPKGTKASRRKRWDALAGLLSKNEDILPLSFSPNLFIGELEQLLAPNELEFAIAFLIYGTNDAAEILNVKKDVVRRKIIKLKPMINSAYKKGQL